MNPRDSQRAVLAWSIVLACVVIAVGLLLPFPWGTLAGLAIILATIPLFRR
jgi:ABC-type Mn2+/Zn2+ transport system permease subunit